MPVLFLVRAHLSSSNVLMIFHFAEHSGHVLTALAALPGAFVTLVLRDRRHNGSRDRTSRQTTRLLASCIVVMYVPWHTFVFAHAVENTYDAPPEPCSSLSLHHDALRMADRSSAIELCHSTS